MIGGILVKIAFRTCLISVVSYFMNHRRGQRRSLLRPGRLFYLLTVVDGPRHRRNPPLPHPHPPIPVHLRLELQLPRALHAAPDLDVLRGTGGELHALDALHVAHRRLPDPALRRRKGYEPQVMSVFGLIELDAAPDAHRQESVPVRLGELARTGAAGFVPANGRGLNPLLQNYWMVIHPQVLFSGFSSMGVPVRVRRRRAHEEGLHELDPPRHAVAGVRRA